MPGEPLPHIIGATDADDRRRSYARVVPVISAFFGIIIRMFYREHGVPHFHAEHQGQQATFTFDGEVLAGAIRSRVALRLIKEWANAHHEELAANWNRMRAGDTLERIAPLE